MKNKFYGILINSFLTFRAILSAIITRETQHGEAAYIHKSTCTFLTKLSASELIDVYRALGYVVVEHITNIRFLLAALPVLLALKLI